MMNYELRKFLLLVIASLGIVLYSQTTIANVLVADYPFNGNVNDFSGNGYNGTISGAIPTTELWWQKVMMLR